MSPLNDIKTEQITPKILLITTKACSYPGVDNAGQQHLEYAANTYVIDTLDPVMFPENFYIDTLRKGIDAIIIMSCGEEDPYKGAFEKLSFRINRVMQKIMDDYGLEAKRIKLTAICTICAKHVVKEIKEMNEFLKDKPKAMDYFKK
jgi:coenzyme F420-reducing hydrogenase delta subunit